jgi:hypothetical protein
MALRVSAAGIALLLGGLVAALFQLGELFCLGGLFGSDGLLTLALGGVGLVAFGFHGVDLFHTAGVEVIGGRGRKVLDRLGLREAVRLCLAVLDIAEVTGGSHVGTHFAQLLARSNRLAVGLGGLGGRRCCSSTDGCATADPLDIAGSELLFAATACGQGEDQDCGKQSCQGFQGTVHVDSPLPGSITFDLDGRYCTP